jgi:hypothetical protein
VSGAEGLVKQFATPHPPSAARAATGPRPLSRQRRCTF